MRKFRRATIFLALISLLYCISTIESTYAKYVTSTTGTTNLTIAKWNIVINNQDVINNSNFGTTITPIFLGTENIKSGVIAPTSVGTFDITLDVTDVDVSLEYTISISDSISNTVSDLRIISYTIDGVEYPYNDSITNQILLNDSNRTQTITFKVEWNDDSLDGASMNNLADTIAANNGVAAFGININFIQIH